MQSLPECRPETILKCMLRESRFVIYVLLCRDTPTSFQDNSKINNLEIIQNTHTDKIILTLLKYTIVSYLFGVNIVLALTLT